MPHPTTSALQLRVGIARAFGMPFQARFTFGQSTLTKHSTLQAYVDPNLTQENDFWKHQFLFIPEINLSTRITSFAQNGGVITPERFVSFTGSKSYEIYQYFTALEIHWAINQAIVSSYPFYYESHEYSNFGVGNQVEFPLGNITPRVAYLSSIAVEYPRERYELTYTSTTQITGGLRVFAALSQDLKVGWIVTLVPDSPSYPAVCGKVSAIGSGYIDVQFEYLPLTSPNPLYDKFYTYNPSTAKVFTFNYFRAVKEFPDRFYVEPELLAYKGSRLFLRYNSIPSEIDIINGETIVPAGYIIPKAVALLAATKIGDTRIDVRRWQMLIQIYTEEAERYKLRHAFRTNDGAIRVGSETIGDYDYDGNLNPLGW